MAKFQSPLLGYNNNVRHKNRVFHIQTEDSGVNHPHIITHLFMDGGRILKSVKKSYAEHVGTEGMSEIVRGLMKEQHKAIFIALRDGQFDQLVDGGQAPAAAAAATAAATAAASAAAAAAAAVNAAATAEAAEVAAALASSGPPTNPDPPRAELEASPLTVDETKRAASVPPPASAAQAIQPTVADLPPPPSSNAIIAEAAVSAATLIALPPPSDPEDVPVTTRQPPEARPDAIAPSARSGPSARELTLDFDALEDAVQDGGTASLFHAAELPPPPKNLFAAKEPGSGGGVYRALEADARHEGRHDPREEPDSNRNPASRPQHVAARSPSRPPRTSNIPPAARFPSNRVPPSRPPGEARYAPARPAAIFGSTQRPVQASIFSDELVSDKSLDEVILSYLAEDLEPPRRK